MLEKIVFDFEKYPEGSQKMYMGHLFKYMFITICRQ